MPTTRQEDDATGRAFLVVIIILLFIYIRKRIIDKLNKYKEYLKEKEKEKEKVES